MKIWQVALALTLLTRLPFWGFAFLNVDEAAHYVGASELVGPGTLYATFADNKPRLVCACSPRRWRRPRGSTSTVVGERTIASHLAR